MATFVNLIKLSVGSDSIDSLAAWQKDPRAKGPDGQPRHVTRMWPKRSAELLSGGSIYWVIQGQIQCRQKIQRLDQVQGADGILRCGIVLDPTLIRTAPALKRPFQGWRYLPPQDAPPDLTQDQDTETALPPDLAKSLADIGIL